MSEVTAHHAVVFEGDKAASLKHARTYIVETLEITLEANPDVSIHEIDKYGVDDARTLKERASQTPLGHAQVFLLAIDSITIEAQNALLKLLEEPADNTYFVLTVPSVQLLLPTVLSRLAYGGRIQGEPSDITQGEAFLSATPAGRIKMIGKMVEDKDRIQARNMLDAIEARLHKDGVTQHATALREIAFVRHYLSDRSSSLKMLLEHLAVTI